MKIEKMVISAPCIFEKTGKNGENRKCKPMVAKY